MSSYSIGIDVGTTGTKTALLDLDGRIVAVAARENALHSPLPGAAEADPERWTTSAVETIREIIEESGISPTEVRAIAASGMVPALVLLDHQRRPVRSALLQNDARAREEVAELAAATEDLDVVHLTGSAVTQQSIAPKCRWLQRHEPASWERARWLVGSYDSVLIGLGAEVHVERNWAIESGLFNLDGSLMDSVLAAGGIEAGQLPQVLSPGDQAGVLSKQAAHATGLVPGIPLVVGGADHVLSAYAAGVLAPGDWLVKLGGAGDILVAADRPIVDSRLYLDAHPVPGHWLPNGCMATSGSLIRWFQTLVGGADLLTLDAEAARRPPAEILCLPYFLGEKSPLQDPDLRGTFAGIHLGHTRADLYRAVLEAIAFGFRHHTEVFAELHVNLSRCLITNGGSRSTLWKQIHAEVLGTEVLPVIDHPGASLGAAILAAAGVGEIDRSQAVDRFTDLGPPVVPDPAHVRVYDEAYHSWRELGTSVTPVSHALARRSRV